MKKSTLDNIKIYFVTDNQIGSILLRYWMWSPYSHCAIGYKDKVISATFYHGVILEDLDVFLSRYKAKNIKVCRVDNLDVQKAWQFGLEQVGKPYDLKSIIGFLIKRSWVDTNAWQCSELATAMIFNGGVTLIRKEAYRVTPADLLNNILVIPEDKTDAKDIL